ncbi:allantoin racemase [Aeromicrobium sp. SORGH_AS981]|jgi:allantoin racemase|uniref:aspartate/glutamate racemase family protein n=1 Tax=Aeromicrobium sp. SORGH_AS_0981 TaxID=3041802 RepID=UPI002854A0D0|nr:aspartate/glutamate racemase family protein [Aeromicrobium sp. SORGH_AS_0981]MDR6118248.1 allantoin racemase [Aeromicrobium sp. SORGH_AS_0981]
MHIRVINPNTTASMTTAIGACASAVAGPDVVVEAVSPVFGPESIESHVDEALAVPGVLARVAEGEEAGVDGYVVACFGDPGVHAARELARGPVVGIAEAGMRAATYLGRRFSVVTTLQRTVPGIEALTRAYGLADHCGGVHATEIGVVDLERDPHARERTLELARVALTADGSDVLVLGCAGMTDFAAWLGDELGVPVVDGVAAATTTVVGLVAMGLGTSKAGEFAAPRAKRVSGSWADVDLRLPAP